MKKLFTLLFVVMLSGTASAQQYNLGFGLRAGATAFLGDIGSGDLARGFVMNMELGDTRWAVGPFVRYRFHPLFAVQGGMTYGRIQGADSHPDNMSEERRGRNLDFTNDIFDVHAKFEYYPQILSVSDVGFRGRYRTDFQTYLFVGIGGVIHGPKGTDPVTGDKVKLRPLMTEGPDNKYLPIALNTPFGAGFFFTSNRQHRIGFEMSWSWTFTDYLDDISGVYYDHPDGSQADIMANKYISQAGVPGSEQYEPGSLRGDNTDRDNYLFATISYSYLIRTRGGFYRRNYSWMYGRRRRFGGTKAKF